MALTTTVTSNQPGGSGYVGSLPLTGASTTSSTQSSPAQILTQLLQEFQQMIQQAGGGSTPSATPSPAGGSTLPTAGGLPGTSSLPGTGTLPATGSSNTNLSNVQLQVGTSGGGTTLAQGPKNTDGSSDLYLPQKDGSEKHVGKEMPDGSIQFDNADDAKAVLGKSGTFLNALGGKLKHNSDGTATLAAGASTLTAGNLPAPV